MLYLNSVDDKEEAKEEAKEEVEEELYNEKWLVAICVTFLWFCTLIEGVVQGQLGAPSASVSARSEANRQSLERVRKWR